ncbi:hypothetical protein [Parasulfitobacter algicola]|uniref:Glycerol-3-phosphate dehydrogenase n=1 Tax=Parasulfitobacter algicola TaxID=2614809 RepID=A0ABX2IYD6_9RHOB|nr:hypothetical protein [Sulfitobacter algicola]NSX56167.1 hypothetical protein [Sulfitobacter algicola]
MSDPVTNTEIENVLSSIRRLVAEDPQVVATNNGPAERLVLSDTDRVAQAMKAQNAIGQSDPVTEKQPAKQDTIIDRARVQIVDFSDIKALDGKSAANRTKVEAHTVIEEEVTTQPLATVEQEDDFADDEPVDILAEEVISIDEESLRDMVAELVRQELQGELGERITRNVRKLIRREIHRALASQELD